MRINKNELRVTIDVDDTLIAYKYNPELEVVLSCDYYGTPVKVTPMNGNIDLLKSYKKRGYEVIVHSANGFAWADEVVNKLGLKEYVDEAATKPIKYVDDKPADQWMQQVYIPKT